MRIATAALVFVAALSTSVQAQAPGSVLCRNGMERADAQIEALEKRTADALKLGDDAAVCEIWQLSIEVRRQAAKTYERCRSDISHENRLLEIGTGAEQLRRNITQYCG